MIAAVADTHTLVWYMSKDERLSTTARHFIDATFSRRDQIAFSSITFVEMIYLVEKGRIPEHHLTLLVSEIEESDSRLIEIPLELRIARTMSQKNWHQVREMPDRIIASTSLSLNVPLISRDSKIRASNLTTIW